jgi:ESS family glutamate:Na+ symporter
MVVIFLVLAALLAFLQNALSVGLAGFVGLKPMIALMTGSIPLTGGHGNAASFAPIAEAWGFQGANAVAVAAATFGLVAGSLMGGPLANRLISKKNLLNSAGVNDPEHSTLEETSTVFAAKTETLKDLPSAFTWILIGLGLGSVFFIVFQKVLPQVTLPIHVMGMLGGVIIRVTLDAGHVRIPEQTIDSLGTIFLGIFVSMAVYTMKLWELIDLAIPIIILLALQLVLIYLFVRFITFPVMGKNYDAAVICAGHIGFGLGAVPVSMANMNSVCSKYRYSKVAFFVVPIIGGLFSNFTNAAIITLFMNWCK